MRKPATTARSQQGAATIFVTIVLLLAVGLIALYTNRGAIMEQRLSANEIRSKQAHAAANAGIEHALAHWRGNGINLTAASVDPIPTAGVFVPLNNPGPPAGSSSFYQARYCDSALPHPICPALHTTPMACSPALPPPLPPSLTQIVVVSCGWSDDDTSVQRITQIVGPSQSLGGVVSTPLIAKGNADLLTGGATVMNYFNDLTVWTGQSLLGASMTGKTFVRNIATNPIAATSFDYRDTGNSPACLGPPDGYVCSSQGGTLGHDTVTGDNNLALLGKPAFFEYMFGKPMSAYQENTASKVLDPANSADMNSLDGMTDQSVWIEGNVIGTLPSGPVTIGTAGHPVIMIINGDLDLGSFNAVINGLVYVHGNVTGGGGPTIYGALVVAGNATATGNIKIIYDPVVLEAAEKIGKAVKLPGTWRDW